MATKPAERLTKQATEALSPSELLKQALQQLATTLAQRAASSVTDRVSATAQRLADYAESGGSGGLKAALTGAKEVAEGKAPMSAALTAGLSKLRDKVKNAVGGLGGGEDKLKLTNIVESIDVGVSIDLAYDQWTRFTEFPSFMKKVENVDQVAEEKLEWEAKILWSHRSWESTIQEQIPDERIVWRSTGDKGYVDGAVTFHELAPQLTRIILVLEYHPKGFFEYTGNLWRAQGRRARLELKHFQRHLMVHAVLHPDEIEGWRGEIRDGEVVDGSEAAEPEAEKTEEPQEAEAEPEEPSARRAHRREPVTAASGRADSS
ncbi:SRPBCC family protein [Saccharomonospora sp. NPDC046836]|uniref:SRPBCC family protein n=1 Tax=Saccharomonospora sp. NPDC046836 TaxID=3156921 RepID=UPI0034096D10